MSVLVIAECGVNHNGSIEAAYQLIEQSVIAGADVCKFQLFDADILGKDNKEYYTLLKPLELSKDAIFELSEYCKQQHIGFACTAFDAESLTWLLEHTKMEFVKISSGQWNNKKLIKLAEDSKLPVIQSLPIMDDKPLRVKAYTDWKYLHVVPQYPTTPENAKLWRVGEWWCSGLSDHSGDIFMPLAAVGMDAQIIESHITLNKNQEGPDHKASLEPHQFKEMVRGIRAIERGLQ